MGSEQFQRNTRQRQVIIEELQHLDSHPTATGLYEIVRNRLPRISLGTVYRNLELLARMGIIKKLDLGGGEARFDANTKHHDHIRCVRCGRVDDVSALPLDLLGGLADDWGGYEILGRQLEFFGLCPSCRDRENTSLRESRETLRKELRLC
jgi:Fur family transcriptional regulator, ferric uptake regulator